MALLGELAAEATELAVSETWHTPVSGEPVFVHPPSIDSGGPMSNMSNMSHMNMYHPVPPPMGNMAMANSLGYPMMQPWMYPHMSMMQPPPWMYPDPSIYQAPAAAQSSWSERPHGQERKVTRGSTPQWEGPKVKRRSASATRGQQQQHQQRQQHQQQRQQQPQNPQRQQQPPRHDVRPPAQQQPQIQASRSERSVTSQNKTTLIEELRKLLDKNGNEVPGALETLDWSTALSKVWSRYLLERAREDEKIGRHIVELLNVATKSEGQSFLSHAIDGSTAPSEGSITLQSLLVTAGGMLVVDAWISAEDGNKFDQSILIRYVEEHNEQLLDSPQLAHVVEQLLLYTPLRQLRSVVAWIHQNVKALAMSETGSAILIAVLRGGSKEDRCQIIRVVRDNVQEFAANERARKVLVLCLDRSLELEDSASTPRTGRPPCTRLPEKLELSDVGDLIALVQDPDNCVRVGELLMQPQTPAEYQERAIGVLKNAVGGLLEHDKGKGLLKVLFELGDLKFIGEKTDLALKLKGKVHQLSHDKQGCRIIQEMLGRIRKNTMYDLVKELEANAFATSKDANGNFVIQRCIEVVDYTHFNELFKGVMNNMLELANDQRGCRVVQRVLEHSPNNGILEKLKDDPERFAKLCENKYGNYVVQKFIEHSKPEEKAYIMEMVKPKLNELVTGQYAIHVVEACLDELLPSTVNTNKELYNAGLLLAKDMVDIAEREPNINQKTREHLKAACESYPELKDRLRQSERT